MNTLVEGLRAVPAPLLTAALAVLVIAESGLLIGVFLPGATALLALGFLTQVDRLPLPVSVVCGMGAALAGTTLGYHAGRRFGLGATACRLGDRFSDRLGLPSYCRTWPPRHVPGHVPGHVIMAGQWLVGARTVVPRLAGASGMPYRRFAGFGIPSAALWGGALVAMGCLAGGAYTDVSGWLTLAGLTVLVSVATGRILRRRVAMSQRQAGMASASGGGNSQ